MPPTLFALPIPLLRAALKVEVYPHLGHGRLQVRERQTCGGSDEPGVDSLIPSVDGHLGRAPPSGQAARLPYHAPSGIGDVLFSGSQAELVPPHRIIEGQHGLDDMHPTGSLRDNHRPRREGQGADVGSLGKTQSPSQRLDSAR